MITNIIGDSHSGMNDVAFHAAQPIAGLSYFILVLHGQLKSYGTSKLCILLYFLESLFEPPML